VRRRRLHVFGFVLALFVFVLPGMAAGQEGVNALLVSQNPDNRDNYEELWGAGTAFATIQEAVDRAEQDPGNPLYIILVEEGTYPETHTEAELEVRGLVIDAGSNILLRGDFGASGGSGRPVVTIDGADGSYAVRIRGVGSGVTLDTFDITGGLAVGGAGIRIKGEGENQVAAPTIMNCVIKNNADGVDCLEYSTPRIVNCMVVDNTGSGIVCHADSEPSLMNNTISGNDTGIEVLDEITLDVTNTIAYGNSDGLDLDVTPVTMELTVLYSDINAANSNYPIGPGPGNISADPWLGLPPPADYTIPERSPCVDRGTDDTDLSVPLVDFEGDPRDYDVVGHNGDAGSGESVVDIGADEWVLPGYIGQPVAYAIPDPTSVQPPGGLVFVVYGSGIPINIVEGLSLAGTPIGTTRLTGGGESEYYIGVNATPIDESTGDGTASIIVDGDPNAGEFLIDTTPPTVGPGPPSPFHIMDGGEGSWTNHNDFIDVSDLNVVGWWELAPRFVPTPNVPTDVDVPNDGSSFFFNTGARAVDGSFPDGGLPLEIDFVVEATDPLGLGADVQAGFDEGWAPSGRPVVRSDTHSDQFIEPLQGSAGPATTWTLQFRPTVEGMYRIEVVAEDRAGNLSESLPLTVYWDKTPPETRISSKPRDPESSAQASFTWRLAGTLAPTFNTVLQYDDDPLGTPASPFTYFLPSNVATYSGLTVGTRYRFTVLGIDDAGNLETSVTPYNQWAWTVSSPVPNTVITSGPPRVTTARTAVIDFNEVPEDPSVGFEWSLWSSLTGGYTDPVQVEPGRPSRETLRDLRSPNTAVQYVFRVWAYKDVGGDRLTDPTPATYTWTVVPPAGPDDPGVPRLPVIPPDTPPDVADQIEQGFYDSLVDYGVGGYVDAPGEQPVKYMREEARRK